MGFIKSVLRFGAQQVRRAAAAATNAFSGYFYPYVYLTKVEGAFPKVLKPRTLYVLTEDGTPWQASMICPCGCGATLELNLLPDEHPRWKFAADKKSRASLDPSVWRKIGCKSHFWLRSGRIIWV